MHFRRIHWVLVTILITLGGAAAIWGELYSMWRGQYTLMNVGRNKQNLIEFNANKVVEKITRLIFGQNDQGLPAVRLYISQQSQANLMKDLPDNIKRWQGGHLIYPDGKLQNVKVRHRGDNPVNWAYSKKSWRVKTTKKRLIDRVRRINYIVPQTEDYLAHFLDYEIHRRMGLPTPDARLIELFINDQSNGIYLELEQLDENFLRRRNIMPVNLYKGEQQNNERQLMIDPNLFGNPRLWKKQSNFNQLSEDNFSDLVNFLRVLKDAQISDTAFENLTEIARIENWARFAAFQTLVQSWGNNDYHNMRLVSDPWKGTIFPIVHDTSAFLWGDDEKFIFDKGANTLQILYNQSSYFLLTKHQILKRFIDEKLLLRLAEEMGKLLPALRISDSRDENHHVIGAGNLREVPNDRLLGRMRFVHNTISKALLDPPSVVWSQEEGILKLVVSGTTPFGKLVIKTGVGTKPSVFAWDADMNGRLSVGDMHLPFKSEAGKFTVEAIWYANRLKKGLTQPTAFNIISDVDFKVQGVAMNNPFTGQYFNVEEGWKYGATPIRLNKPIIEKVTPAPLVLEGNIVFKEVRVFDLPVEIRAGTVIRMYPGASLIFQSVVTVLGKLSNPVQILPAIPEKPWGVFAIYGPKASGSLVQNLHLNGGSGQVVKGVHFIAMLSVHDTSDVIFDGIILRRNKVFDDAMHIIYSKNINLKNSRIENAHSDGLDIDISWVDISRTSVTDSGNDAVDLMSSRVTINQSRFIGSGDKGISVGELSTVLVLDTLLKDNQIGLESKDGSDAYIINTDMLNNKIQINAYQKNWRYGQGGRVAVNKVFMRGDKNLIKADKRSRIELNDNTVRPSPHLKGRNIIIPPQHDYSSGIASRKAENASHTDKVNRILGEFKLIANPAVRGMQP